MLRPCRCNYPMDKSNLVRVTPWYEHVSTLRVVLATDTIMLVWLLAAFMAAVKRVSVRVFLSVGEYIYKSNQFYGCSIRLLTISPTYKYNVLSHNYRHWVVFFPTEAPALSSHNKRARLEPPPGKCRFLCHCLATKSFYTQTKRAEYRLP